MKRQIPNLITLCNLLCGVFSCIFAYEETLHIAAMFICLGIFFDFFDGMAARLLGVASPLGKELDSLADVVTSGVAPGMIFYVILAQLSDIIWLKFLALLIPLFAAYRLAKFNLDERQALGFIGLPTPANALFWGSLIWRLDWQRHFEPYMLPDFWFYIVLVLIPISSYLLVSEIPMFALKFKTWGWKGNEVKFIFLITCIPLLLLLGISGLAAIIAWYVILSVIHDKYY